jgi:hypothetical protein
LEIGELSFKDKGGPRKRQAKLRRTPVRREHGRRDAPSPDHTMGIWGRKRDRGKDARGRLDRPAGNLATTDRAAAAKMGTNSKRRTA